MNQGRQAFAKVTLVLLAALGITGCASTATKEVKDLNEFGKMNGIYGSYFKDKPPARATVQVVRLPRDVLVEISAIAAK